MPCEKSNPTARYPLRCNSRTEISRSARQIQHQRPPGQTQFAHRAPAPPRIHPERHDAVHQVVATRDRVEQRSDGSVLLVAFREPRCRVRRVTRHAPCRRAPRAPPRRPPPARCATRRSPAARAGNGARPVASRPAAARANATTIWSAASPSEPAVSRIGLRTCSSNSSTARSARPCIAASASRASESRSPSGSPNSNSRSAVRTSSMSEAVYRSTPSTATTQPDPLALHRLDQRRGHAAPVGELLERQAADRRRRRRERPRPPPRGRRRPDRDRRGRPA